jgi:hypothetical protein
MIAPRQAVGLPAEDLYVFLNDLRRIALVAAIVVGTLLPRGAAAQSDTHGEVTSQDDPTMVVAPADIPIDGGDTSQIDNAPVVVELPAPAPTAASPVAPVSAPVASPTTLLTAPLPSPVIAPSVRAHVVKRDKVIAQLLPDSSIQLPVSQNDQSVAAINRIPSPVGAPLFYFFQPVAGVWYLELRLAPSNLVTYTYSCPAGQCSGPAKEVWQAVPIAEREQYLSTLLQTGKANQTWGASSFEVSVVTWDTVGTPLDIGQGRGCALLRKDYLTIEFAASCAGPFQEHLSSVPTF